MASLPTFPRFVKSAQKFVNRTLIVSIVYAGGFGTALRVVEQPSPVRAVEIQEKSNLNRKTQNKPNLLTQDERDRRIYHAICLWEHRGHIRPDAVNKSENAHGPAQIRQLYLDDANEQLGTSYTLQDCHDYETALKVVRAYWAKYKLTQDEERARCHNGGPRGHLKAATLEYWAGVQTFLPQ